MGGRDARTRLFFSCRRASVGARSVWLCCTDWSVAGAGWWGVGGRVTVSRLIYNNYEQFNTFFFCSITMTHAFEGVVCVSKFCTVVRF